ncbi:MAG: hypothetical protein JOS17DRAFT_773280 [Linnemannia elongata]|nr:MAG: hypothetical protein JOS17DRAFT_773280 [Linnemannia elongata]
MASKVNVQFVSTRSSTMSSSSPQGNSRPPHPDPAKPSSIEQLQGTNNGKRNLFQLERQTKLGRRTLRTGAFSAAMHQVSSSGVMHPGTYTLSTSSSTVFPSPPLNYVHEIPTIEQALLTLRTHRLAEYQEEVYIPPLAKLNPQAPDANVYPLMDKVGEFLAGNSHVMLILGDSGAGKSTFNRHLENRLWQEYKVGDRIPPLINLPAIDRPDKALIAEQLATLDFTENQIYELKRTRRLLLICDGYDESQLTVNLHKSNNFNTSGEWNDYRDRFVPHGGGHYNRPSFNLFQEAVITPFSTEQIKDYVVQYAPLEPRTWQIEDYMDKLMTIPNLMDLVKNPFLLSLALEALPGVIEGNQDLSTIRITRAQLYDTFVQHWSNVNKRRLQSRTLSMAARIVFDGLLDMGFVSRSIDYSTRLALAIFEQQDGNPIVQYVHDKNSWKAQFFGQDTEVRFL